MVIKYSPGMGFEVCLRKGMVWVALVGMALAGCGGSSSSGAPAQGASTQAVADFTAVVNVNVSTGAVTFTTSSAASKSGRTVFTGPTVSMSSTTLVTQAGTPGVKSTSVTLTNNSSSPIGVDPNGNVIGVRVLFGAFTITGGSSADPVALSNPTGFLPSPGAANVSFISYPVQIATNKASPAQNWNFDVPSGVTAFSVPVTIEAENSYSAPPNGAKGSGSASVSVRTIAGSPTAGFSNGNGTEARFSDMGPVAVDRGGNIYASDSVNNCIRRITPGGNVTTVAGTPYLVGGFQNGPGNQAQLNFPLGLAVTPDGSTIYFADGYNNMIRRIALTGTDPTNPADWTVSTVAGTLSAGGANQYPTIGTAAGFYEPYGVCLDPAGNLGVTEYNGSRVRRVLFLGGDPASSMNWEVTLIGGDTSGLYGYTGDADGSVGTSRFYQPEGIAADGAGNFYVADAYNNRIRKVTPDGITSTFAGGTSGSTVTTGYIDGTAAAAEFDRPIGIAIDAAGLVYVADTFNYRIREISQVGNVTTIAGTGSVTDADGTGATASFALPIGVAVAASGSLFVGDSSMVRLIERINSQ